MQKPQKSRQFLLDTNTVSFIIKGRPLIVSQHLRNTPMEEICLSSITEAERLFGVAKKAEAKQLAFLVEAFLLRVKSLPWDSKVAETYAKVRLVYENKGKSLGSMDMLIASHAMAIEAVLVTSDKSFFSLAKDMDLTLQDWTKAPL